MPSIGNSEGLNMRQTRDLLTLLSSPRKSKQLVAGIFKQATTFHDTQILHKVYY